MMEIAEKGLSERRAQASAEDSRVASAVKSTLDGDRAGFDQIVTIYQERIFRMAYYRTGSRMDAEDLTQDIFIKALKGLPTLKDIEHFGPWLFSIARNRIRDFKKKKQLLVFFGIEGERKGYELSDIETHDNPQGVKDILRKEFWDQLKSLMEKLSRWEREVFLLKYLDQLTIREISQVLNKSESAVKTHLYRAIGKFKKTPEFIQLLQGEIR